MAGRFLDLDEVRKPLGTFRLVGAEYTVWPLRIRQIINMAVQEQNPEGGLQRLINELHETIPDCPRDALEAMDIVQLNALSAWIQGAGQADAEKNSAPPTDQAPPTAA